MSYTMQTPQRPLPGAYLSTPAANRLQSSPAPAPPSFAARRSSPPASSGQAMVTMDGAQVATKPVEASLTPAERAAKNINATLAQELNYPELDSYVNQGISSDYDLSSSPSWNPFQRAKTFPIPDKIFEQYNNAHLTTRMGLFGEIDHAYVVIDNSVYLFDYTQLDPPLVGYEEQSNSITAVELIVPRPGVFASDISRILVVATVAEVILVALSVEKRAGESPKLELFSTRMSIPVRGLNVTILRGTADGRIFFTGTSDNHVYELTYQQEERWFYSRCLKVNHTASRAWALTPSFNFGAKSPLEYTVQMAVDDSRRLLYTLSSTSTIRVFNMQDHNGLSLAVTKPMKDILTNIGHMMTVRTELISSDSQIIAIHPIPSKEASKLHLMATTSTGCRIFLSGTTSFGFSFSDPTNLGPMSMQVHHVKFPPPEVKDSLQTVATSGVPQTVDTSSKLLMNARMASRYPPGFFFCIIPNTTRPEVDDLFVSAPDTGRIARPLEQSSTYKFSELGLWANLESHAEDVEVMKKPFPAASSPQGYANELATQFDEPASEVAILTNTGVHIFRRQRLIDMFITAIRFGRHEEGLAGTVKRFIRLYGRSETLATALAVACGQGLEITSDYRSASVPDTTIIDQARSAFIEYGGKPLFNENILLDQATPSIDMVKPSPRHDGLALYISRLVRSFWNANLIKESTIPGQGLKIEASISLSKLEVSQRSLIKVKEFLESNKTYIEGLTGPEALGQASTKQQEIALQAEHRAMHSLLLLIANIVEGISFVQMLFDESVDELVKSLPAETRGQIKSLTYQELFATAKGKSLAKDLVKAIVNRNILSGANVETVADALRRRCGSFCSASDVIIFKAQEQLKRAAERGSNTELGRNQLRESIKYFKEVADSLSAEQLHDAITKYISMQFYAGAISLALDVAHELDRGNRALWWIQNGRPEQDPAAAVFAKRKQCYDMIHEVILAIDDQNRISAESSEGDITVTQQRRVEAYEVIDTSDDEVFQTDLYDWYLARGDTSRLLLVQSDYIKNYLKRRSSEDIEIANLLWRYYSQAGDFFEAATVQLDLARSDFRISLNERIEYLTRAKANASSSAIGIGRQRRQQLLREVADLLDIATIQDDLLQQLVADARLPQERVADVSEELGNQILPLTTLYNTYADQASYHDVCLLIYKAADHRSLSDVQDTWRSFLQQAYAAAEERGDLEPNDTVAEAVRKMGNKLGLSETIFPVGPLTFLLETFALEHRKSGSGAAAHSTWVPDVFVDLGIEYGPIFEALESTFQSGLPPFVGAANRVYVARDVLYLAKRWFLESSHRAPSREVFGNPASADIVRDTLTGFVNEGIFENDPDAADETRGLIARIDRVVGQD